MTFLRPMNVLMKLKPREVSFLIKKNPATNHLSIGTTALNNYMRLSTSLRAHDVKNEREKSNKFVDFNNPQGANASKTYLDLLRAVLVYKVCRIPFVVENASSMLSFSYDFFGHEITNAVVKSIFFKQFCAGEDINAIQAKMNSLKKNRVSAIFDYAAESDSSLYESVHKKKKNYSSSIPNDDMERNNPYKYERQNNFHFNVFKSCIDAVGEISPDGNSFAAVKVTALGNPKLLESNSNMLRQMEALFAKFDKNKTGMLTQAELEDGFRQYFNVSIENNFSELFEKIDPHNSNSIRSLDFSRVMTSPIILKIIPLIKNSNMKSPLALHFPTEKEFELMDAMYMRAYKLAKLASESNVRLLFDAEQSYYQPCIDNIVLKLQETYNHIERTPVPIIFHTYQCYLKGTIAKLEMDLERSERCSYHSGIKLVRGAYMNSERQRAMERGYCSPIHDCIEDTHKCYDRAMEILLKYISNRKHGQNHVEVMCASHNQKSIEKTLRLMGDLGTDTDSVHFAQLLGMSDNLTYPLSSRGYRTYKYAPYGNVGEVIPYLLRRLEENSSLLGNADKEIDMAWRELKRRAFGVAFP